MLLSSDLARSTSLSWSSGSTNALIETRSSVLTSRTYQAFRSVTSKLTIRKNGYDRVAPGSCLYHDFRKAAGVML